MHEYFSDIFNSSNFMPHGHCYLWRPDILWVHLIGDLITAFSYFIIPFGIYQFVRNRKDLQYKYVFVLFCLFIFACGSTHLIDIYTIWVPVYKLESIAKLCTGIISFSTAVILISIIPKALSIPSQQTLAQKEILEREVEKRKIIQQILEERSTDLLFYSKSLETLQKLTARRYHALSNMIKEFLKIGCELTLMKVGILGKIKDDTFQIIEIYGEEDTLKKGDHLSLAHTIIQDIVEKKSTLFFPELPVEGFPNLRLRDEIHLGSFIGTIIFQEKEATGILCFYSDLTTKRKYGTHKRTILDLLAQNLYSSIKLMRIQEDLRKERILLRKGEAVSHTCSWVWNLRENMVEYSGEFLNIFELNEGNLPPNLDNVFSHIMSFSAENCYERIYQIVLDSQTQKSSWETEFHIVLPTGNRKWIKMEGAQWLDEDRILGIIQDITSKKLKELELKQSIDIIGDQNKRLLNFAHIVSHNLRSHVGNLGLLLKLFEMGSTSSRMEILKKLKESHERFDDTINHLNETVKIQTTLNHSKEELSLTETTQHVMTILQSEIENQHVQIDYDFSRADQLQYIPAYLESILQNLISNAIKYKHPDRAPHIRLRTYWEDEFIVLEVKDNGIGINLEKHGDKIFGMYKTFHENSDARGIGLFLTKNQVESLGGKIRIDSKVNVGTTFFVHFLVKEELADQPT